jgi:hypothetical protein
MDTAKNCSAAIAEVRFISDSVLDSATHSITLLKAIEQTVEVLAWLQNQAKTDYTFAVTVSDGLKTCNPVKPIDAEGILCASLEQAEIALENLHQLLTKKCDAANKAPELEDGHKEAVIDEYQLAISAVADLHNAIVDLRWAVGEHDADLEESEGLAISDPQELMDYLNTL